MAGFYELATGLWTPSLAASGPKWPIVSGGHLKNSRFCEIAAGDRVRSALRGGGAGCREETFAGYSRSRTFGDLVRYRMHQFNLPTAPRAFRLLPTQPRSRSNVGSPG